MTGNSSESTASDLAAYSDLFDRLLDCTFLVDPVSHLIVESNPACERILELNQEQIVGQPIHQWVEESLQNDFAKALRISLRRHYTRQFESTWTLPNGRRLSFEVLACPLKLANETELLQVIARDITSRKEAEQKIQVLLHELQDANAQLEALSITDEMTGLFNFRYFKTFLSAEYVRCQRTQEPFTILFFDIDHFKIYNDKNGHPAGDALLKEFAQILKTSCRTLDLAARYGGEEFILVCPATAKVGGVSLAERIRKIVETTPFVGDRTQPGGKLTVSIGVATFPEDGRTPEEITQSADQALYGSKKQGRNRVSTAS